MHRQAKNVSNDLAPEWAGRATTSQNHISGFTFELGIGTHSQVIDLAQGEGNPLQDCAGKMAFAMMRGQADKAAPGCRIIDRTTFTGQVGQEDQPLSAGRRGRRCFVEQGKGAAAELLALFDFIVAEGFTEPVV